jgi:16S rRNA (cytosine1402-N4)-methyltransferase
MVWMRGGRSGLSYHRPVMAREILALLSPTPEKTFCDATLGGGGHSEALLTAGAGKVFGLDRDPEALSYASARLSPFGDRFVALAGNFRALPSLLPAPVDGLVLDLGVSSAQLDRPERGFSFRAAGPLDMRMGPDAARLSDFLEETSEEELARVIYEYGEERKSRGVARAILRARDRGELKDTLDLAKAVRGVVGAPGRERIDPATRTFQGLRIALNDELNALSELLAALPALLKPGGVVAALSYHSLEDRILKNALRAHAQGCVCPREVPVCVCGKTPALELVHRKPELPTEEEIAENPRARSAKLRAARRLP